MKSIAEKGSVYILYSNKPEKELCDYKQNEKTMRKNRFWYNVGTVVTLIALFFCVIQIFLLSDTNERKKEPESALTFEVSPIFCDNMILQQNEEIRVWGTSPS